MLVEVLTSTQPEPETVAGEDPERRRLLRNDRRVIADCRAGDVGHQSDPLGRLGSGSEDRPCVSGVALLVEPRLVVV
jgi:hypothetical protein